MPACRRCGSRSVEIVLNPLTFVAHVLTHERRTRCPRCGWTGWQHQKEWAHIAGGGIWRGAGGVQGNGHGQQLNSTHGVNHTPPDAMFEQVVAEAEDGAPDLAAVDSALDEHERNRAERRAQRTAGTSPRRAASAAWNTRSRRDKLRGQSSGATSRRNRNRGSDLGSTHSTHLSSNRGRISRRALRRMNRKRMILLVSAVTAALVVAVLMNRACSG